MVRKGFKMFLYPGMEQEYKRRHNLLWPEMKEMIREYGGHNYSIYLDRDTNVLYGYIEPSFRNILTILTTSLYRFLKLPITDT